MMKEKMYLEEISKYSFNPAHVEEIPVSLPDLKTKSLFLPPDTHLLWTLLEGSARRVSEFDADQNYTYFMRGI